MSKHVAYKLVLLGESAVGKSSLVHRFSKDEFDPLKESTIGAAFITKLYEFPDGVKSIKFEIWDTAGQERYKSLTPMYYRNAKVALVVYDVSELNSFKKAQYWIKELGSNTEENIIVILVGNKADLMTNTEEANSSTDMESSNVVNRVQIDEFCRGSNIKHYLTSAKTGEGVNTLFDDIANGINDLEYKVVDNEDNEFDTRIDLNRLNQKNGAFCC